MNLFGSQRSILKGFNGNLRTFRRLALYCLFVLLLSTCSTSAPTIQPPDLATTLPIQRQPDGHPPVILQVDHRNEVADGVLWVYQDIYFMDADGDANAMTYAVTSSSLNYPLNLPDEPIEASAAEQKVKALFTVTAGCGQKVELSFDSRVRDKAGNLSEPVPFRMSCTVPQPIDIMPLLISGLGTAIPIALLVFLGYWLFFRKRPADRLPALRSTLLICFVFMFARFFQLVIHEGGHSLYLLLRGVPITLYVHPFFFQGFSRPIIDTSIWKDILGSAVSLLVGLVIFLLLWKRRNVFTVLPWVMLFSFIALTDGFNVMGFMDDFHNLVQSTGLPAVPFMISGISILCIGLITMLSLLPLAGLDPQDNKALVVLPTAMFFISALTFLVAHLFVPGSPIDLNFFLGRVILPSANTFVFTFILGIVLAVLYITLFRKLYPRLPAWLHAETVALTWYDLRVPGLLWVISMVIGLIIVI